MKASWDEGKYLWEGNPPVGPVMDPVPYPEFMRDLPFFHGDVDQRIPFV